jgi:hypothetical protein
MPRPRLSDDAVVRLVNEALAVEAEAAIDADALGFLARAMVQATLPHRRVAGTEFERRNGAFRLSLLAPSAVGLPYGSVPRLLLAWLTTEAVRTQSRELVLGDSLSAFMRELGLVPTGGRWGSIGRVKEQTKRLFSATVSCSYEGSNRTALLGYRLADKALLWWDAQRPAQAGLWASTVTLSEQFYTEVINRPVPVDMRALRALKRSPLALDLYAWLTYRMSYLQRQTVIPWAALAAQFGSDYRRLRAFKAALLLELQKVELIYPEVRVTPTDHGLALLPSKPHIPRLHRGR